MLIPTSAGTGCSCDEPSKMEESISSETTGETSAVYEEQKKLEGLLDNSGDGSGEDDVVPEEILLNSSTESVVAVAEVKNLQGGNAKSPQPESVSKPITSSVGNSGTTLSIPS